MDVTIERDLLVDAPLVRVWPILRDVPRAAACAPGTTIGEQIAPGVFRCDLGLKVGPFRVGYRATLHVDSLDQDNHAAEFTIRTTDAAPGGHLAIRISTNATEAGERTRIHARNEISVEGPVSRLGPRAIEAAGGRALATFARNLSALV